MLLHKGLESWPGHRPSISGKMEPPLFRVVSINTLRHRNALQRSSALASTVDMFVCIPFCCESGPHSSFLDQSSANRKPLEIRIRRFMIVGKSTGRYRRLESAVDVSSSLPSSRTAHLEASNPAFHGFLKREAPNLQSFSKLHIKTVPIYKAV